MMAEVGVSVGGSKPLNFLTWEIDTTGKLLCDEFFHMACLSDQNKFDVYVMPYRNISHFASLKYQVITKSHGLYRYLRRRQTGKIIKTITEIVALREFLSWIKKNFEHPVVLMAYESYDFAPYILIQALKRYDMLEEFKGLVHGFGHSYAFVKKKCKKSMSSMNLRSLAKILLNKNDVKRQDAFSRAKLLNEILLHLCDEDNPSQAANVLANEMRQYVKSVDEIEKDLVIRTNKFEVQCSLNPIFAPYLKGQKNRKKVLALRSSLLESEMDYKKLDLMWKEKGRDEFKNDMNDLLKFMDDRSREDVIAILLLHFESNENKVPIKINSAREDDSLLKDKKEHADKKEEVFIKKEDSSDKKGQIPEENREKENSNDK